MARWESRRENVLEAKSRFRNHCLNETPRPIYRFNDGVLGDEAVTLSREAVQLNGGTIMEFDDDSNLADYQLNR